MVFYKRPETKTWGCYCTAEGIRQINGIYQANLCWETEIKTVEKTVLSKIKIPKEGAFVLRQEKNRIYVVTCCGKDGYFDFEGMRVFYGTSEKAIEGSFGIRTPGMPETMHQFKGSDENQEQILIAKKVSERRSKKGALICGYKTKAKHVIEAKKPDLDEDIVLNIGAFASNPIKASELFVCDKQEARKRRGWCSFVVDMYDPMTAEERKQKEIIKRMISL